MNDPINTCSTDVPDCAPTDTTPVLGPEIPATPNMPVEFPAATHVAMEPGSIYSLGYNLAGRLTDYDTRVGQINQLLTNSSEFDSAQGDVRPVGRDVRWTHIQNAVDYHSSSMTGASTLIETFRTGMDRMSRLTRIIVNEVGGVEAQNQMSVEDLETYTGLNANNSPNNTNASGPPSGGGPGAMLPY